MRFYKILCINIGLILMYLTPVSALGQSQQISQVIPYLSEDSLKADLLVENLFQGQILKTLLAGIGLDIEIKLSLSDYDQREISQRIFRSQLTYDVWEERFWLLDFHNNTLNYDNLEDLQNWSKSVSNLGLLEQNFLSHKSRYQINSEMRILILGREENQQLKWWIENSDQTEEDIASRERSTGFKLNLNQLVQMFFSREKDDETFILKKSSGFFTISELKFP